MNSCAVAIPIYKQNLSDSEYNNLSISLSNLTGFDVFFFAPNNLDISIYVDKFGISNEKRFPNNFFSTINDYSRLMLSSEFYLNFLDYSHILICQPDAIALKPELNYWIDQPYDYLGAPWPKGFEYLIKSDHIHIDKGVMSKTFVGNGGFSLRNVKSCLALFEEFSTVRQEWMSHGHAEDLFFGLTGALSKYFRLPNMMIAAHFSHETEPEFLYKLIGSTIPFGCHAYEKYSPDHWKSIFKIHSIKICG